MSKDNLTSSKSPYFVVVMPIGYDLESEQKTQIIQSISDSHNIAVQLPTYNKATSSFSIDFTLRTFDEATFALVDLSFERPSCYYELGLLESVGTKVYLIAEQGTPIHQSSYRASIMYFDNIEHYKEIVTFIVDEATRA